MNDYDLYGIKIAMNDGLMVFVDNLNAAWYTVPVFLNTQIICIIHFNETTCNFVYSVVVPISNISSFVYNCIDLQGRNVIGLFESNATCSFYLSNEKIVSNYSTQNNFIISINGDNTAIYGFADDFLFYYELNSTFQLTVWPNSLNISPRAADIGANNDYAVVVGYCQLASAYAVDCGFIVSLNRSLSCPNSTHAFSMINSNQFAYSDPRISQYLTNSRDYSARTVMSVSIAWRTRLVLIGVQSFNMVLLYSLDDPMNPIGTRQNGIELMGFGKTVAWLDDQGEKAVILANSYTYSTYQWISSFVHIYDIQSDGFSDSTQPVLIYPNSQQILFQWMIPQFIRLVCSSHGHLAIFDDLGIPAIIYSTPSGTYPNTNSTYFTSNTVPCILGTYRNYTGIELCIPCTNGTYAYSNSCSPCTLPDSFCPYGAVEEISYSTFESIEQDQDYPESPENTVFDDILMQNMFSFNTQSGHCALVSPITWVLLVIGLGVILAGGMFIHELWAGGLGSAAVIVIVISAYSFSNQYLHQYPIQQVTSDSSFACDVTLRNAKFSTTMQMTSSSSNSTKQNQVIFNMLNSQSITLNVDLIQTAFICNDSLIVQRVVGSKLTLLPISACETSHNGSILSLAIALPTQKVGIQLILPGSRTVGAIRLGLSGPSMISTDKRSTLLELNFSSAFVPPSSDEALAPSTSFAIGLTAIVNQTDPLNSADWPIFSAIWSSSFDVITDELFTVENRYTFFQRSQTNISITIQKSIYYVNNQQEPIARQTEIIFHNLLFTIVVLELFCLLFLINKLLISPLYHNISSLLHYLSKKNRVDANGNKLPMAIIEKFNRPIIRKAIPSTKPRH
ncbi:unnamed protein product [Rotaria socialis]|uniref:Transmembrane protein n=1 Tax=Rotaria socialis TaxID=392032 RepID=A0A818VSW3_9BILA|nr:unnamed protein product [Rotaria socialis]CAF4568193.1 unnamed protein product [Rotaria socialis]